MSDLGPQPTRFDEFDLAPPVLRALAEANYTAPTPIQQRALPIVLSGRDILGQAQTGTGKTAAFALPLLSRVDMSLRQPQVLVLAPTRELAIQIAKAFEGYGKYLRGLSVAAIYGGADMRPQLRELKQGAQIVVGTPGRIMDHMRRGSLVLDALSCLVLDEADEMLRMGFLEDVEWIAEHIPDGCQRALFSATMPPSVKRVVQTHLNAPAHVRIETRTMAATTIRQRYVRVSGHRKMDALERILEAENTDAVLIFVRTKAATVQVADCLERHGADCAALNGDIAQDQRERVVGSLRRGRLKIIVATDVAARGLDVDRISHVFNYDMPHDVESYVHRVGRTGRAGREGQAISFVTPKDRRLLRGIESVTRKKICEMAMPTTKAVNKARVARFKQRLTDVPTDSNVVFFRKLLAEYIEEHECDPLQVAAALATLLQGKTPLLLAESPTGDNSRQRRSSGQARDNDHRVRPPSSRRQSRPTAKKRPHSEPEEGMERYRLGVGHDNGVEPRNIVGAITNETGLGGRDIGRIDINGDYCTVDLPTGMSPEVVAQLQSLWLCNVPTNISRVGTLKQPAVSPTRKTETSASSRKPKRRTHRTSAARARSAGRGARGRVTP